MPDSSAPPIQRHYGLDWLRIGAFGLLIVFHVGLYFAPGHWIVKAPRTFDWVAWPLAAIVPWRLSVLFAVSGYATAAMIQRNPALATFLAERSQRLLIPLLFGMLVVIPPQEWVRLEVNGEHQAWAHFLGQDAFSFARHAGTFMPGWEHLWFLPYLWGYTVLLVGLLAYLPSWRDQMTRLVGWLVQGRRLLWAPAATMAMGMALLAKAHLQGLADSADYLPAFLIGFAYAHCAALRAGFLRHFGAGAIVSMAALAVLWALLGFGMVVPDWIEVPLGLVAGAIMSWTMVLVCFNLAERLLNRDHRWRQPLAAAVFPAYIVHQTAIVLTGWNLAERGVTGPLAFVAIFAATVTSCSAAWLAARQVPLVGVLLGLQPRRRAGRTEATMRSMAKPA